MYLVLVWLTALDAGRDPRGDGYLRWFRRVRFHYGRPYCNSSRAYDGNSREHTLGRAYFDQVTLVGKGRGYDKDPRMCVPHARIYLQFCVNGGRAGNKSTPLGHFKLTGGCLMKPCLTVRGEVCTTRSGESYPQVVIPIGVVGLGNQDL